MPRACPVEWSRCELQKKLDMISKMPRACPVVLHATGYKRARHDFQDATGLSRGVVTLLATKELEMISKMPRACPVEWSRCELLRRPWKVLWETFW